MTNPISTRARGILYILGIVFGLLFTLLTPALRLAGVNVEAQEFATLAAGVFLTLLATLSRANLGDPNSQSDMQAMLVANTVSFENLMQKLGNYPVAGAAESASALGTVDRAEPEESEGLNLNDAPPEVVDTDDLLDGGDPGDLGDFDPEVEGKAGLED